MSGQHRRRDFLIAAGAAATFAPQAGRAQTWTERYVSPGARVGFEIDVSDMSPGQVVRILLSGKPVDIRYRTQREIDQARAVDVSKLIDQFARNANLAKTAPATDQNRTIDADGKWLVHYPICTHLGCVTLDEQIEDDDRMPSVFCPCHTKGAGN